MIINTGQRTDIPAFYSDWLANRLRVGYVMARSPYDDKVIYRYSLSPDVVDAISFCTKNPAPMFPYMDLLAPYRQYWFVTITGYGKDVEPNVPCKGEAVETFRKLSDAVGSDHIAWRYDPVLLTQQYTMDAHMEVFRKLAMALSGYTDTCIFSFIDLYGKVRRNWPELREVSMDERRRFAAFASEVCGQYGMKLKSCAEGRWPSEFGIDTTGCMTRAVYEKAFSLKLDIPPHSRGRKECDCLLSSDVGAYNTCAHFCRYCYANYSHKAVLENMQQHDDASPLLVGWPGERDEIRVVKQNSWISGQGFLF